MIHLSNATIAQDSPDGKIGQVTTDAPATSLTVEPAASFAIQNGWLVALSPKTLSLTRTTIAAVTAKYAKGVETLRFTLTVKRAGVQPGPGPGPGPGPVSSFDPLVAAAIMENVSAAPVTNLPWTFSQDFLDRDIPHFPEVLIDGVPIPTQANVSKRFASGCAKVSQLTMIVPSALVHKQMMFTFRDQPTGNETTLTIAEMIAAFGANGVQSKLRHTGTELTIDALAMLAAGDYTVEYAGRIGQKIRIEDRSVARKWDVGFDVLRPVHPVIYATIWPAIAKIEIYHQWAITNTEALENVDLDELEVLAGTDSVYKSRAGAGLTLHLGTSPGRRFWIGGAPEEQINFRRNVAYLNKTDEVKIDASFVIPEATIAADYKWFLTKSTNIYGSAGLMTDMPATGGRSCLGSHPAWCSKWLLTGDWRYRKMCRAMGDAADCWRARIREGKPGLFFDRAKTVPAIGLPISIFARPSDELFNHMPTITLHSPLIDYGWTYQLAHVPDLAAMILILEGGPEDRERLDDWACFDAVSTAVNANNLKPPLSYSTVRCSGPTIIAGGHSGELRAMAWGERADRRMHRRAKDGSSQEAYALDILMDKYGVWMGMRGIPWVPGISRAAWDYGNTMIPKATKSGPPVFALNCWMPQESGDNILNRSSLGASLTHGATDLLAVYQQGFMTNMLGEAKRQGYAGAAEMLAWIGKHYTRPFDEGAAPGSVKSKVPGVYNTPLRNGVDDPLVQDDPTAVPPVAVPPEFWNPRRYILDAHGGKHQGGQGPYFQNLDEVIAAIKPAALAGMIGQFDNFGGNFAHIAAAAAEELRGALPNGDVAADFYRQAVQRNPKAVRLYQGGETCWKTAA